MTLWQHRRTLKTASGSQRAALCSRLRASRCASPRVVAAQSLRQSLVESAYRSQYAERSFQSVPSSSLASSPTAHVQRFPSFGWEPARSTSGLEASCFSLMRLDPSADSLVVGVSTLAAHERWATAREILDSFPELLGTQGLAGCLTHWSAIVADRMGNHSRARIQFVMAAQNRVGLFRRGALVSGALWASRHSDTCTLKALTAELVAEPRSALIDSWQAGVEPRRAQMGEIRLEHELRSFAQVVPSLAWLVRISLRELHVGVSQSSSLPS